MSPSTFSLSSIKGRVAETIIRELFLSNEYNVFDYGMERSIPGVAELTRKTFGPVKNQISTMPDFVVQDKRNDRLHFVEVKYRANGRYNMDEVKPYYPWPHAFFIIVSKEHIKCLTYKQLAAGRTIYPDCKNHLANIKMLALEPTLIAQYGQVAKKFFTGV